jgi:hypothetical protein
MRYATVSVDQGSFSACREGAIQQNRGIPPVGASLLAKNVNDNAALLDNRAACQFFASKLAPTRAAAE